MKKLILGAVALTAVTAAVPASATVVPGDLFTFAITGFNSAGTTGYVLGSAQIATFGTTQTFAAAGFNGQNYTITSSELVGATTTTATFRISTPTSFLTSATVNGTTISLLQFELGTPNSGVGLSGGANPVNLTNAITSYTSTGTVIYGTANNSLALTPTVSLATGGLSFAAAEGVNSGTTAISQFAIHDFIFSITYANPVAAAVPEPATWTMMIAGFGAIGFGLRRRKQTVRVTYA